MSRAAKLAEQLGTNMNESLGVRLVPAPTGGEGGRVIPATGPEDGRSRDRLAGHMELDRIIPDPNQPRKTFTEESLRQLSESLKSRGQLQAIRVRWSHDLGKWVIISGERRYRAAILAGWKTIACQFVDKELSETDVRQDALIENLLREDLKPIEAAEGYRQLMELNGWTVQRVADSLNITKGTVSKALALLKLPDDIRAQVDDGLLSASAAYEVTRVGDADAQRQLVERIVTEGLKRDEAGAVVGKTTRGGRKTLPKAAETPASTTKVLAVGKAKVTMTWAKKAVREDEVVELLEKALAQVKAQAG